MSNITNFRLFPITTKNELQCELPSPELITVQNAIMNFNQNSPKEFRATKKLSPTLNWM